MLPAIAPQTAWCTKHIKIYSCQLHYDFRPHHTTSISSSSPTCHSPASDNTHVLSRSSSSTPSSNISTAHLKRLPAHQVVCISRHSFRQYHVFFKLDIGPSCHIVISIYIVSKKGILQCTINKQSHDPVHKVDSTQNILILSYLQGCSLGA